MNETVENLFAAVIEFLSPSRRRYVESLAPLMVKRQSKRNQCVRKVSLFGGTV